MKNIKQNFFFSANSEHYQDAFLKWIFFNFNADKKDELLEIEKFSRYFVEKLLNYNGYGIKSDSILEIEVENQVYKSDVNLIIKTKEDGEHLILIEDKTNSSIHSSNNRENKKKKYKNQLEKYYDSFISENKYEKMFYEGKVHLFYYKNDYLGENEEKEIGKTNLACKEIFEKHIDEYNKKIQKSKTNLAKKISELPVLINTVSIHKDDSSIYTWNILDINTIKNIFKCYTNYFEDTILQQYIECLEFKKKWLDVETYPLYLKGYDNLSDNYKKMAWFSYLKNYVKEELKNRIDAEITEPYWHQGGNDINIALRIKKDDLPHIRVMTNKISDPDNITIQVAIYGAEKKDINGKTDNSYYKNNKEQINRIEEIIQEKYDCDSNTYLLKRYDTKSKIGEKKTIATTESISIHGDKNIDDSLINILIKCFNQLKEIPEDIRKIKLSDVSKDE